MSNASAIKEPKGITHGSVPTHAFDDMTTSDITAWLKDRFQDAWSEYCPSPVDDGGVISWTKRKFPKLSPEIQARFADAVVSLMDEMLHKKEDWKPRKAEGLDKDHNPATELFLFTQSISKHLSADDKTKIQNKILPLLESPAVSSGSKQWALSTLANIDYRPDDDFWLKKYVQFPKSKMLVFKILAEKKPEAAFDFLAKQPWKISDKDRFS